MATTYAPYITGLVQLGKEVTSGTEVAADVIWRGPHGTWVDAGDHRMVEEQIGILAPSGQRYTVSKKATLALPETEATYEQITHILEAGLGAGVETSSGPSIYTWTMADAAVAPTIKTYTVETYNALAPDDQTLSVNAFVESFSLSGEMPGPLMVSANWVGHDNTTAGTHTTGLTPDPNLEMVTNDVLRYWEADYTTNVVEVPDVLQSFSLDVTTGLQQVYSTDKTGAVAIKYTQPEITFSFTFELEEESAVSQVALLRADYRAITQKRFRLRWQHGGSTRDLYFTWAGHLTEISAYEESDGNTLVTISGVGKYNENNGEFFEAVLRHPTAGLLA